MYHRLQTGGEDESYFQKAVACMQSTLRIRPPAEDVGPEPSEEYSEEWLEWVAAKEEASRARKEWDSKWTLPSCCWLIWLPQVIYAGARSSLKNIRCLNVTPTSTASGQQLAGTSAEAQLQLPLEHMSMSMRVQSLFLSKALPQDPPPPSQENRHEFGNWQAVVVKNCQVRLGWLPPWAYAAETAGHHRARSGLGLGLAVPWAFLSTIVLWVFYASFPLFAVHTARCSSPCGSLAQVPKWLLVVYFPTLAIQLAIEWMVLRHTIVAHTMRTAPFRLVSMPLRYEAWLLVAFALTILGHTDITSTGVVLAEAAKTGWCAVGALGNERTIPEIWRKLVDASLWRNFPGASDFTIVVCVSWALLLLQPAHAMLMALPLAKMRRSVDYTVSDPKQVEPTYQTYLEGNQNHQGAILMLARVSRMGSVLFQNSAYEKSLCCYQAYDAIAYVRSMKREVFVFGLFLVTEVIPQLNVQTSLVALGKAVVRGHGIDGLELTVASVVLSELYTLYALAQTSKMIHIYWTTVRWNALDKQHLAHARKALCQANMLLGMFIVLGVFDVLAVLYAAMTLWKAVECPDAVWNLNGCVDLSSLDHPVRL